MPTNHSSTIKSNKIDDLDGALKLVLLPQSRGFHHLFLLLSPVTVPSLELPRSDDVLLRPPTCRQQYTASGFFTSLPFRPLDHSPPGLFAPWLIRPRTLDDSPPGFIAIHSSFIHHSFLYCNKCQTHSPLHMTKTYYDYVTW